MTKKSTAQQTQSKVNYNYRLLQNSYNPYAQTAYSQTMRQMIEDWQLEKSYCVDGKWMNLEEFVTYIYPEDCAERTYLILRLQEKRNTDKS
jgi:hypothetical protein